MNKHIQLLIWILLLLPFNSNGQKSDTQLISLDEALTALADLHKVYFSYDVSLLHNYQVSSDLSFDSDFDQELKNLLKDTPLKYKMVGRKNYVIFESAQQDKKLSDLQKPKKDQKVEERVAQLEQGQKLLTMVSEAPPLAKSVNPENKTINGIITDENGEPLTGVTIILENDPSLGTVSDFDGSFSLEVPEDAQTLIFSYVGYQSQKLPLEGKNYVYQRNEYYTNCPVRPAPTQRGRVTCPVCFKNYSGASHG